MPTEEKNFSHTNPIGMLVLVNETVAHTLHS